MQVRVAVVGRLENALHLAEHHNVFILMNCSQSARADDANTTVICTADSAREQFMAVFPLAATVPNPTGEPYVRLEIAQPVQSVIEQLMDVMPNDWGYLNYLIS